MNIDGINISKGSKALCLHLTNDNGECGRRVRYTTIKHDRTFTCNDVYDAPERVECSALFEGYSPVLYLEGPTFIFSRTPHFPHFLEEVASGANWLANNNLSYFSHALIDESGGACQTHSTYRTGSWAPMGSPLSRTLQMAMIQTIARGIVFSWGIREKRSVCFGKTYRKWQMMTPDLCSGSGCRIEYFDNPAICASYRRRMMKLFNVLEPRVDRLRVLILQRFSGGRLISNLADIRHLSSLKQLNLTFDYRSLEGMSVGDQVREFAYADILIAHHGAAIALASLMRRRGLVIEIFNYNVKCDFFDYLYRGCGLNWERLVNTNGTRYSDFLHCNGNNRKDDSDNASVDLAAIAKIIETHVKGKGMSWSSAR
jgi:hypothetical protein